MNKLLLHEKWQRERYKNTLSDLAHSLKTPLAIATGALAGKSVVGDISESSISEAKAANNETNFIVSEQLQRMSEIVQYQLQRAASTHSGVSVSQLAISPVVNRLLSSMKKVYADKSVVCHATLDESCQCKIDERDLMELLGNLLDNAFKYCESEVSLFLYDEGEGVSVLEIGDDGPGVAPELRASVFSRGKRLDSVTPGQGIGLTVAMEIVKNHQATLAISESKLGGALFTLRLPMSALSIQ